MAPSNSYYNFESNTSSYSFWNSPDYFKLYDDVGIWNQTITILNHTTSSIPPLLASVSPSTATKFEQYDDSFSFDDDDDDSTSSNNSGNINISNNNNNNNNNNNILRNGKNLDRIEYGRRSKTNNGIIGFRNIFNSDSGKEREVRIAAENSNLLRGNKNLNHDHSDTSIIDYSSNEFGVIDGSNGYSNTQTGGFERFFNSKNSTNSHISNIDDINNFDNTDIIGINSNNNNNNGIIGSTSNVVGNGGDGVINNNGGSSSISEIYQNYDTGGLSDNNNLIDESNDNNNNIGGVSIIGNRNLGSNGFNGLSNSNNNNNNGNGASGSNFMLLFEDFGEYFYNYNSSNSLGINNNDGILIGNGNGGIIGATSSTSINITDYDLQTNCSSVNATCTIDDIIEAQYNYWALILILFPILTLFGNILVILSVLRERSLQTVTNYFIVSLALADLLVAVFVMPFGVYVLVSENNIAYILIFFYCETAMFNKYQEVDEIRTIDELVHAAQNREEFANIIKNMQ
ncbi:probable serine/threonine-protein kinase clkA [Condylostylus longicornis]|uniref:probable serine/threonine-protein kinase clkA n=1 Tax=Condylostylus longicornis TaxID=2530218 RepID=UPI00244DA247|nr:probable serine/threonine-protein kinase clkA [Condylostylus longicornis]